MKHKQVKISNKNEESFSVILTNYLHHIVHFPDHVYFVHPSTDISVDISVDILTDTPPMYWSTYRPSFDRYVS